MVILIEIKVGSKGELFLPKKVREQLALETGDRLYIEVRKDELLIKKAPDLLDLLELSPLGPPQTPEEAEKELEDIQKEQIDLSMEE